ncbi:2'-5' RNA ligase family protein [Micromonospora sp. WMMD1082]|uniref:2'-5' RNA ligase family protein n=1 Tax=Micromonospora sp. WMMD1082 TaxID=3016104 RepID=UPI002418085F|nr:2'-5' RNA ligase family protein [Micromonospora sp. WMMD1082]MDG4795205.1 2'-5' RNA ligase family protein [Micromonospora sp. WMMD1082]
MRSFDETMWSPPGSRPHIEIPASGQVHALAEVYLAQTRTWWAEQDDSRPFEAVFRPVAPEFRHLTVAWLDQLTADITAEHLDDLHTALGARLRHIAPFDVTVGPAIMGLYALELYVAPHPQADAVAAAARAAIREVFGAQAAPEPPPARPWRPHITACYGRQRADTDALASRIAYTFAPDTEHLITPATMPVDAVLLVDQNTWGPTGLAWDTDTARRIPLGHPQPG